MSLLGGLIVSVLGRQEKSAPNIWSAVPAVVAAILAALVLPSDQVAYSSGAALVGGAFAIGSSMGLTPSGLFWSSLGAAGLLHDKPVAIAFLCAGAGIGGLFTGQSSAAVGALCTLFMVQLTKTMLEAISLQTLSLTLLIVGGVAAVVSLVENKKAVVTAAAVVQAVAIGFLIRPDSTKHNLWIVVGASAVAAIAIVVFMPETLSGWATMVGAMVSVGLATVAFSFGLKEGLAISTLLACSIWASSANNNAQIAILPMLGMVGFRALSVQTGASEYTLDLSRNYSFLALVLGAFIPALISEWRANCPTESKQRIGLALIVTLLVAVPSSLFVLFGGKAAVAWLAGLGFSGVARPLSQISDAGQVGLSAGLMALTFVPRERFEDWLGGTRDHRIVTFGILVAVAVVIVIVLQSLVQKERAEVVSA